jgi:integrase
MLVDEWVETVWKVLQVRPTTLHDYKRLYRRHLQPVIGNEPIGSVTPQALQIKLLSLPPQTARHTLMLAKTIWREALLYGITESNPTAKLRTPSIQVIPRKFLTWEEVDAIDWGKYNNQIRFLALHGLRWSEAVALTEADIHDGFVWVNKSKHGPCKSNSSVRKVPYLGYFETFPRGYKTLQQAASGGGINLHSLRKTYAYLLKTQNVHVTMAQKLLGHSSPILTLKVYTGVKDEEMNQVAHLLTQGVKLATQKNIGECQ